MLLLQEKFYLSTVFYGQYVRNTIIPYEAMNKNPRNSGGKKNEGHNQTKLLNSNIRAKTNAVRKAYENFWNVKKLTFLTLTYALNENNIRKCKSDLAKFFRQLKTYFKKEKNKEIKYCYVYEYQQRGAIHFHILVDAIIPHSIILKYWLHGLNKNLRVRQNTNEQVVLYCSKYITKSTMTSKSLNQYDLNIKSYQFSYSCTNPKVIKRIFIDNINSLVDRVAGSTFVKFLKSGAENIKKRISGVIYEFKLSEYEDINATTYITSSDFKKMMKLKH